MKILEEIINGAITDSEPVANLLRRCLVLEYRIKNEKLKFWANKELDGYDRDDNLPEYRKLHSISRGLFLGGAGSQINDQPLSLGVMEPEHRKLVDTLNLTQPISAYETRPDKGTDAQLPWPPALTTKYQSSFIRGYALNRAWQEVPGSVFVGLVDTVRNRILRFALELQDQLGAVDDNISKLQPEKIEHTVVNNIYGGNITIAASAQNITQVSQINIGQNDLAGLANALATIGVTQGDIAELKGAIQEDSTGHAVPTLGAKVQKWLMEIGKTVGKEGLKVGVDIAKQVATKWIMQYYGLPM